MLKQAVRLTLRGMPGKATGRLAADLNKYVALLEAKAHDDPSDDEFWEVLHKTASKLVRCLRQAS